MGVRVLFSGWPLVRQPNSLAALHLLSLLAHDLPGIERIVALPGDPPFPLPAGVETRIEHVDNEPRARLGWEQSRLLRLARQARADGLHVVGHAPPVLGQAPVWFSPVQTRSAGAQPAARVGRPGWTERLRGAMADGGMARVRGWLWPADLPDPETGLKEPPSLVRLPPAVHPAFQRSPPQFSPGVELPEAAVIFHGDGTLEALQEALAAWTWAAGPVGEISPLLLVGLSPVERAQAETWREQFDIPASTVQVVPPLAVEDLAALYASCAAVLHPQAVTPWDGPARLAIASAAPLVAYEDAYSDALAGQGAYLVSEQLPAAERRRRMGAALITVIVEEGLAETLRRAARERAAGWQTDGAETGFGQQLARMYRQR